MLAHTRPLAAESVPLTAALGRTLAADVVATDPLPPFPASMMVGTDFSCAFSHRILRLRARHMPAPRRVHAADKPLYLPPSLWL